MAKDRLFIAKLLALPKGFGRAGRSLVPESVDAAFYTTPLGDDLPQTAPDCQCVDAAGDETTCDDTVAATNFNNGWYDQTLGGGTVTGGSLMYTCEVAHVPLLWYSGTSLN